MRCLNDAVHSTYRKLGSGGGFGWFPLAVETGEPCATEFVLVSILEKV
jgi:hypothetical protein